MRILPTSGTKYKAMRVIFRGALKTSLFLLLLFLHPVLAECTDWYRSTLECEQFRREIRSDTSQDICGKEINKLKNNSKNLNDLIRISYCLQHVAPETKKPIYHESLVKKLYKKEEWYQSQLKKYRLHKEFSSALDLAYMTEFLFRNSSLIRPELNELYRLSSNFFLAGMSYLQWLKLDGNNMHSARSSLNNIIQKAKIEFSPKQFLDSLINNFSGHNSSILTLLEELCFIHKNYEGALASYIGRIKIGTVKWTDTEKIIKKFIAAGYYDYAGLVLQESSWEKTDSLSYEKGFDYALIIFYHLKNWNLIIRSAHGKTEWQNLSWENKFYLAAAYTRMKQGEPDTIRKYRSLSRTIASQLIQKAPSPWNYKAILIQAENLIAEGRFAEARKTLMQEQKNKQRKEGTGPLLFWRAVARIYEGEYKKADSLLVLASAYTDGEETQRALQFRHWMILDSSRHTLESFLKGLPESPFSIEKKRRFLNQIPPTSPLWDYGQLEIARLHLQRDEKKAAQQILKRLETTKPDQWTGLQAKAVANFIREKEQPLLNSLEIYDEILLKYQQGVISEFSRERIRHLKSQIGTRGEK
jgi:hypothetical protein